MTDIICFIVGVLAILVIPMLLLKRFTSNRTSCYNDCFYFRKNECHYYGKGHIAKHPCSGYTSASNTTKIVCKDLDGFKSDECPLGVTIQPTAILVGDQEYLPSKIFVCTTDSTVCIPRKECKKLRRDLEEEEPLNGNY